MMWRKRTKAVLKKMKRVAMSRWTAAIVLALALFAGLMLRLWLSPAEGYGFDVGTNKGWSFSAVGVGVGRSYTSQLKGSMLPNYPPMSLLIFHATGYIYMKTLSANFDIDAPIFQSIIKLPAMLSDLVTALLLAVFVARWKKSRWWGVLAGILYVFHPVPIHDSAVWGQTDAIYSMFLVAAFGTLVYGFGVLAGLLMALALLTKLQAIACVPLFVIVGLNSGWRYALKVFVGGVIGIGLVLLPFWWTGFLNDAIRIYTSSVGFYDSVSSAAYNFWWSLYADEAGNMHDTDLLFDLLSFRHIGLILFGLSALFPIVTLWRGLKASPHTGATLPAVFYAAAFSMYGFFLWNTQMHERYSFAIIPLGLTVAFFSIRAFRQYAFLSILIYLNVLGWLHAGEWDRMLFDEFPTLDVLVAAGTLFLFFAFAGVAFDIRKTFRNLSDKKTTSRTKKT